MESDEIKAWQEFKQIIACCPPEKLTILFNGDQQEREDLCQELGIVQESLWLVEVLVFAPREMEGG